MRLYIIRHADPDYENNTITPHGHLEAKALAKRMEREGIDRIYSSPLGRALDTAKYTADSLKLPINIEEWTKEISDIHVNLEHYGQICAFNLHGEHIREDLSLLDYNNWYKIPQFKGVKVNETYTEIIKNSDAFIKNHGYERMDGRYRCINPNRKKIAIFCHAGFGMTWLAHLLEIPLPLVWSGLYLATSSVTTVLFEERTSNWAVPRCIGIGDTSHLYDEGLPVLPRGLLANFY